MSDAWLSPSNNSDTRAIREVQLALGLYQSGQYDVRLARAVADFQSANNLVEDGLVGPATWAAFAGEIPAPKKKAPAKKAEPKAEAKKAPAKKAPAKKAAAK